VAGSAGARRRRRPCARSRSRPSAAPSIPETGPGQGRPGPRIPMRTAILGHGRCARAPQTTRRTVGQGRYGTSGRRQVERPTAILLHDPHAPSPIDRPNRRLAAPHGSNPVIRRVSHSTPRSPAHPASGSRSPRSPRSDASASFALLAPLPRRPIPPSSRPPRDVPGERRQGHCRFTHSAPSGRPSAGRDA
jgi:hypothetical protein